MIVVRISILPAMTSSKRALRAEANGRSGPWFLWIAEERNAENRPRLAA